MKWIVNTGNASIGFIDRIYRWAMLLLMIVELALLGLITWAEYHPKH